MHKNIMAEKATNFAKKALTIFQRLKDNREFILSKQFLRSSTSIIANIVESEASQSRRDFISKLGIARRELRETQKWLELLEYSQHISNEEMIVLQAELTEIHKILNSSIGTARKNSLN